MSKFPSRIKFFFLILLLVAFVGMATFSNQVAADDVLPVNCIGSIGIVNELVNAIEQANSDADHDTIVLGSECIYAPLTPILLTQNALPVITEDLTIEGNGSTITRSGIAPFMRHMEIAVGVNVTLQDVHFRDGSLVSGNGGAILADVNSTLNLENAGFENNKAENGGAVYTQGDINISGGTFFENEALGESGGAVYALNGGEVSGALFQENTADEAGGALYSEGQTDIHDSVFLINNGKDIDSAGGAVNVFGQVDVSDSKFYYNSAGYGGALAAVDAQVERSLFYLNSADSTPMDDSGLGGALYLLSGSRGLTGNHFHQNEANKQGGAVYVIFSAVLNSNYFLYNSADEEGSALVIEHVGGNQDDLSSVLENNLLRTSGLDSPPKPSLVSLLNDIDSGGEALIRHNTVVNQDSNFLLNDQPAYARLFDDNRALSKSESLASWTGILVGSGQVDVENNIIAGFKVGLQALGGDVDSRSNLYFENTTNEVGLAQPGSGLLDADPLFVDFDNFRLTSGSPAENSALNSDLAVDIRGEPRDDGQPDRGAYEYDGQHEAVFLVECGDEAGLVEAIRAANNYIGPDVLHLQGEQIEDCLFRLSDPVEQIGNNAWLGLPIIYDQLTVDGARAVIRRDPGADPFQLLLNISHSFTLQNLDLENGVAEDTFGGAVSAGAVPNSFFDLALLNVGLNNNFATVSGGAAYAEEEIYGYEVQAADNEAGGSGGALGSDDYMIISESSFERNKAQRGGAIFADGNTEILKSTFLENEASDFGGAVYASEELDFYSNFLVENVAGDSGGGLALEDAREVNRIFNNVWVKNSAMDEGAAVYVRSTVNDVQVNINYNTFVGDETPNLSGVYMNSQSITNVTYSANTNIITDFGRGIEHPGPSGAVMTTNQNLYFDNDTNEAGSYDGSTNHIIGQDPLFLNPAQNIYLLQANSPARDAADVNGLDYDRLDVERPQGPKPDIGAHEFTDNLPPMATADYYFAVGGVPLEIPAPGVLGNDQDPENGPLQAVLAPEETLGNIELNLDGSFVYTAPYDFSGQDGFLYLAQDSGGLSTSEFVIIVVVPGEEPPPPADDHLVYMPVILSP